MLEAPSQALQQAIKDLEKAYKNFFAKRSSFPRFKKRSSASGFRFPQGFKIDEGNARIFLPKLGWLRYRKSRSAKGTLESPGRNVRAKSGLNKSILDQGWFEFRRQLEYKTAWCGGELIAVNPMNTSRTCPKCGHVSADNRKTQAVFCCIGCGHLAHADHVGAINILARGHRVAACGEVVRHKNAVGSCAASVKQEPTETLALTG